MTAHDEEARKAKTRKGNEMNRNLIKTFIGSGLAVLITVGTLNTSMAQRGGGGRLEGAWNTQVTIIDCQTGNPIRTFANMPVFMAGGTMVESTSGTPPALRTQGEGVWRHTTGNNYVFRFKSFSFNAQNIFTGWTIIQADAILDSTGDAYTSSATIEVYGPNGLLLVTLCAETAGTRFEI
jgi:hypothetical protein